MSNEETIQYIIKTRFNGSDNPETRAQIKRQYVFPSGPSESQLNRQEAESTEEYWQRRASAERAAAWNEQQRHEIEAEPKDSQLKALEMRLELKLAQRDRVPKRAFRGEWERRNEDYEEARAELNDYQQKLVEVEAQQQQVDFVAKDPEINNAIENIEAILRTASRRGENDTVIRFTSVLNRLRSVTPETKNRVLSETWGHSQEFEDREVSRMLETETEVTKATADQMKAQSEAETDRLTAQHRADKARLNREYFG